MTAGLLSQLVLLLFLVPAQVAPSPLLPNRLVAPPGLPSLDMAIGFQGKGHITLPRMAYGGIGFSLLVDVYPQENDGCIFSAGLVGRPSYIELRLVDQTVQLSLGGSLLTSNPVVKPNTWHRFAWLVNNYDLSVQFYLNGVRQDVLGSLDVGIVLAQRIARIAYCPTDHGHFYGFVDNLRVFNDVLSPEDIQWNEYEMRPYAETKNLVMYYHFNDLFAGKVPENGLVTFGIAGHLTDAMLLANIMESKITERESIGQTQRERVWCGHSGVVIRDKDRLVYPPFFGRVVGGFTQYIRCVHDNSTYFTVNQRWSSSGGITELMIETSKYYQFKISAPSLKVYLRTIGGWVRLPPSTQRLPLDATTFELSKSVFMLNSGKFGSIQVEEHGGLLSFTVILNIKECPPVDLPLRQSQCQFLSISQSDFYHPKFPPINYSVHFPSVSGFPPPLPPPPATCERAQWRLPNGMEQCVRAPGFPPTPAGWFPPVSHALVTDASANECREWPSDLSPTSSSVPSPSHTDHPVFSMSSEPQARRCYSTPSLGPIPDHIPNLPSNPCQELQHNEPTIYNQLSAFCGRRFHPQYILYTKCLHDACITRGTHFFSSPCAIERLNHAIDSDYALDRNCFNTCENDCSGRGLCTANGCSCDDGYSGPDCSLELHENCYRSSIPYIGNISVIPTEIQVSKIHQKYLYSHYRRHAVPSSVVVLTVDAKEGDITKYTELWILNNNGDGAISNGGYTLNIEGLSSTNLTYWADGSAFVSEPVVTSSGGVTVNVTWSYDSFLVIILSPLPLTFAAELEFTERKDGFHQLLLGSSTSADPFHHRLSMLRLVTPSVILFGEKCKFDCSAIKKSDACRAHHSCGWCTDHHVCVEGSASGPIGIRSCTNWKYSNDPSTARRVTAERGIPISPSYSEFILHQTSGTPTSTDSERSDDILEDENLALEIEVEVTNPDALPWDIALLLEWTHTHKETFVSQLNDFLAAFADYPNLGISICVHRDPRFAFGDTQSKVNKPPLFLKDDLQPSFHLVKALTSPLNTHWIEKFTSTFPEMLVISKAHPIKSALIQLAASTTNSIGWRDGARKVIFVTSTNKILDEDIAISEVREALLSSLIVPVFAVDDSVRDAYSQLVHELGFGLVTPLRRDSEGLKYSLARTLKYVSGRVTVLPDSSEFDLIDMERWNAMSDSFLISGLGDHSARFFVPLNSTLSPSPSYSLQSHFPSEEATDLSPLQNTLTSPPASTRLLIPPFGTSFITTLTTDRPIAFPMPSRSYGLQSESQVVELGGKSLHNAFYTVARIIQFPIKGTLYQLVMRHDSDDVLRPFPGNEITTAYPFVDDALSRVIYRSSLSEFGPKFDSFKFVVNDANFDSLPVEVIIDVSNRNDPPIAEIMPPWGEQDRPIVLHMDAAEEDLATYDAFVLQTLYETLVDGTISVHERLGTLYQYDHMVLESRENAVQYGQPILGPARTLVTDPERRLIYWPHPHTSSHADYARTPNLLVRPFFSFEIVEKQTIDKYSSAPLRVPIDIRAVNEAPFVFADTSPDYPYSWPTVSNVICWRDCVFDQDLGRSYPWESGYVYIYVGGDDVERTLLDVIITQRDCDPQASIESDLIDDKNLSNGSIIRGIPPGVLYPALRFRAGDDRNDERGGRGDFYCQLAYRVRDGDGALSASENLITISIKSKKKPPRLRQGRQLVTVIEEVPSTFLLDVVEVTGAPFTTYLTSCSNIKGSLEACLDESCNSRQTLDCANIPPNGILLQGKKDHAVSPRPFMYNLVFRSDSLVTLFEGFEYQTLIFKFHSDFGLGEEFPVTIHAISINHPPSFCINDKRDDFYVAIPNGAAFHPQLEIVDPDVGQGYVTVTIVIETPKPGSKFTIDFGPLEAGMVTTYNDSHHAMFSGTLVEVNAALAGFYFESNNAEDTDFIISFAVTDNGFTATATRVDRNFMRSLSYCESVSKYHYTNFHGQHHNYYWRCAMSTSLVHSVLGLVAIVTTLIIMITLSRYLYRASNQSWSAFSGQHFSSEGNLYDSTNFEAQPFLGPRYPHEDSEFPSTDNLPSVTPEDFHPDSDDVDASPGLLYRSRANYELLDDDEDD